MNHDILWAQILEGVWEGPHCPRKLLCGNWEQKDKKRCHYAILVKIFLEISTL